MIALPKVNGAVGMAIRAIVAYATGPAKIDRLQEDVTEIKKDVKTIANIQQGIISEVRELKGYNEGRRDAERGR